MEQIHSIKEFVNNVYWSLMLQGIALIMLAVAIIIFPALLVALAVAFFLVMGVTLVMMALKVRKLWNKMPSILK